MGHTPCARYIYLGFDSEVSWGVLTSILLLINRGSSKTSEQCIQASLQAPDPYRSQYRKCNTSGVRQKKQRVSLAGSLGVLKVGSYSSPLSFYYLLYLEMINDLRLLKVSLKVGLKLSILTLIKKIEILLKGYTLSNLKLPISSNFKREKEL